MNPSETRQILLISGDLFLGSRIRAAAEMRGASLAVAANWSRAIEETRESPYGLIIVDLETPGVEFSELSLLRAAASETRIVAYAPHVRKDLLQSAKAAGCDEVMTRGQFDSTLSQLFASFCGE